jgi:CheY-like chemotaxis protein
VVKVFGHHVPLLGCIEFLADLLLCFVAVLLAASSLGPVPQDGSSGQQALTQTLLFASGFAVVMSLMYAFVGLYRPRPIRIPAMLRRTLFALGVGLTLARRLAELHGGRVEAYSDGAGQGAEFRVFIPCISVVRDDAAPDEPPAAVAQGCRILIVDDNNDAAESVARFLELEGHEVKTVADGAQALASVPVFAPQVVVLDIGLPGLSGYEVARRIRTLPPMHEALLIALTGYGQKEDQLRAIEAGFDRHFVKPTDPRTIVELIAHWQRPGTSATTPRRAAATRSH